MSAPPVRVERRVGQRFPYLLPLTLRQRGTTIESVGFTQDLSSRGVFFFTDAPLTEGAEIELTLRMPSEITLGESMPVCCRGRVLRIVRPVGRFANAVSSPVRAETKIGVAVRLEGYEYLHEVAAPSPAFARISTLRSHDADERPMAPSGVRPILS